MTLRYEALPSINAYDVFKVTPPQAPGERHVKPRKTGFMVRAVPAGADRASGTGPAVDADAAAITAQAQQGAAEHTAGEPLAPAVPAAPAAPLARELVAAQWGLVPHWVKSASDGRLRAPKLVNAYYDTVSTGTAFRDAWLNGQRCIVPM
ncbi:MAG: hypothetical protein EOO33_06620, partial [Comamonadaceae bacterium]